MLEHERVSIAGPASNQLADDTDADVEAAFATAEERSITPLASARQVAHERLAAACRPRASEAR
jgi:hypothetical protein